MLGKDDDIVFAMNDLFSNVVSSLNIPEYEDPTVDIDQFKGSVLRANKKNKNHPRIRAIKEKGKDNPLTFENISKSDIKKEILNLDSTKAIQDSHIPTKIFKRNADVFTRFLFVNLADLYRYLNCHL